MIEPIVTTPVAAPGAVRAPQPARPAGGPDFASVLDRKIGEAGPLRFSGHALQRLEQRGIRVDGPELGRLEEGVERAASKGARDSVVLVDGTAFVVSVKNRTVVTAVGEHQMREHVFTNIDSAVIA